MKISDCCGALPCGETFEDMGFCSRCHEHASFEDDEECDLHPLWAGFAQKDKKAKKEECEHVWEYQAEEKDTNIKECTFCIKCDTEIDEEDYICCNCIDDTDGRNQNFFNIKKEKE